ncbi:MAG: helix-turn-helix transcriptional regulator [Gammaproteobacteria bacterium]|nr:helix-turn-helix transcriptional regulator [Gammaproteobacteria bacterium]
MKISKQHYTIKIAEEVKAICEPFFQEYQFNSFFYSRLYDDHTSLLLTSHQNWHWHHLTKQYKVAPPIPNVYLKDRFCYMPCPASPYQDVLHDIRSLFNLDHPFYIFEHQVGFVDMYCFTVPAQYRDVYNFYLNKMHCIETFIASFQVQAKRLIIEADQHRLILNDNNCSTFNSHTLLQPSSSLHEVSQVLAKRELECLYYLQKGRSFKEIATYLKLSPRTVEFYLQRVKKKLNCRTRSQLIDYVESKKLF